MLRLLRRRRRVAKGHVTRPASRIRRLIGLIVGFATCIAARAFTNLASAGYAPAHWCVMISLCTPVVCPSTGSSQSAVHGPHRIPARLAHEICTARTNTVTLRVYDRMSARMTVCSYACMPCMAAQFTAAIGRFCLRQPLPPGTLVALVSGLGGSALAIFGGAQSARSSSTVPALLALGIGLAFASSIALAVYQHIVKLTKGVLSEGFVLTLNYAVMLVPAGAVLGVQMTLGTADAIASFAALNVRQWVVLCVFSSVVYIGANLAQQLAIRQLGPTLVAALMPLRLLSSVTGSAILLHEGISSSAEAGGLLMVAVTTAVYLSRQLMVPTSQGGSRSSAATSAANQGQDGAMELQKKAVATTATSPNRLPGTGASA